MEPLQTFHKFASLPNEIAANIWRLAVPDPGSIRGAIPLLVDFDLATPRAILPCIHDYQQAYHILHHPNEARPPAFEPVSDADDEHHDGDAARDPGVDWYTRERYFCARGRDLYLDDEDLEDMEERAMWRPGNATMPESRAPILSLMRTCRGSRSAALERYRLDIGSQIEAENKSWWTPEEDLVIFLCRDFSEYHVAIRYLFRRRESPLPALRNLQHVAFVANRFLLSHMIAKPPFSNEHPWQVNRHWFRNLPDLQSFTLLVDPGQVLKNADGKVLLHEPEECPMQLHCDLLPLEFLSEITRIFADSVEKGKVVPLVDLFVAGRRRPRRLGA